jgi:hypothetical protein
LHLLGRCSSTWAMPPSLCFSIFLESLYLVQALDSSPTYAS